MVARVLSVFFGALLVLLVASYRPWSESQIAQMQRSRIAELEIEVDAARAEAAKIERALVVQGIASDTPSLDRPTVRQPPEPESDESLARSLQEVTPAPMRAQLARQLLGATKEEISLVALEMLLAEDVGAGISAVDDIIESARRERSSGAVMLGAIDRLGRIDDAIVDEPLFRYYEGDAVLVRAQAARVLRLRGHDSPSATLTEDLVDEMKTADASGRKLALLQLAVLRDERALPGVLGALGDDDEGVRLRALLAARHLDDARVDVAIETSARRDASVEVRRRARALLDWRRGREAGA